MEGYLSKLSSSVFTGWQSKFFILENNNLIYFNKNIKKYINLYNLISVNYGSYKDKDNENKEETFEFHLILTDRIYDLKASNITEAKAWVECISVFNNQNTKPKIPSMVQKILLSCLNHIESSDMVKGIFKDAAPESDIKHMCNDLLINGPTAIKPSSNVYCVASVFLKLLHTLPQSLLTDELVQLFLKAATDPNGVKILMSQLPSSNRVIIRRLTEVCAAVVDNREITGMSVRMLSNAFGPCLVEAANAPDLEKRENKFDFGPFFVTLLNHKDNLFHNFIKPAVEVKPPPEPFKEVKSAKDPVVEKDAKSYFKTNTNKKTSGHHEENHHGEEKQHGEVNESHEGANTERSAVDEDVHPPPESASSELISNQQNFISPILNGAKLQRLNTFDMKVLF